MNRVGQDGVVNFLPKLCPLYAVAAPARGSSDDWLVKHFDVQRDDDGQVVGSTNLFWVDGPGAMVAPSLSYHGDVR